MNSCAYEEKMKRIEIYQSWLQEKQELNAQQIKQRTVLLQRLCNLQDSCGATENFLSCEHAQSECQKMIFLWSNCKEMKQAFGEESAQVQEMLKEYAKFSEDLKNGWQAKISKNSGLKNSEQFIAIGKERLEEKLDKCFAAYYYIGDISIDECEYDLLVEYTRDTLKNAMKNKEKYRTDLLIVTFMVKVAQKHYKGKFWGAFFEQLKLKADQEYKNFLEKTLIYTLQKNDKYIVNKNERLNTIFFHAFICDYYANAWFELLLEYYLDDLSACLANHTPERYHHFLQGISEKSKDGADFSCSAKNNSDSYTLRRATLTAMEANEKLSMIKANQALELINRSIKTKTMPALSDERINKLFAAWALDSYRFNEAYVCPNITDENLEAAELRVNFADNSFILHLKSYALLGSENNGNVFWLIKTVKRKEQINVAKISILSGEKSAEADFQLNYDELFGRIKAELYRGEEKITEVLFKGERVRLFTPTGLYSAKLALGRMYAYANKEINVQSFAITKRTDLNKLALYQLDCAQDDIVVIDNYEIRALGAGLNEGLNERGKIANFTAFDENNRPLAVYGTLPVLAITLQANKINASSIIINSSRYSLRSCRMLEFEKPDAKGVKIVLVDLRDMPSFKDGRINRVSVDIINSSSLKSYSFVYCQDLQLNYAEAKPLLKGAECKVELKYHQAFKIKSKNIRQNEPEVYSFELNEGINELFWTLEQEKLNFSLKLMPIAYSFDGCAWQYAMSKNILAADLPEVLYLKNIAAASIKLNLAERFTWEYQEEDGVFACDLKPLLAALNYVNGFADLDLIVADKRYNLTHICLHNYIKEAVLACDYNSDQLIFKCTPLKETALFADIYSKTEIICTKQSLDGSEIRAKASNLLEDYYVALYMQNETNDYQLIFAQKMKPFDWQDMTDGYILLEGYSDTLQDDIVNFSEEYMLYNIEMQDEGLYHAAMAKKYGTVYIPWIEKVEAEFYFDSLLSKCHLTFYQEEDEAYNDFLVDLQTKELLTSEDDSLSSEEKYSRYKMMFDGECVYYTKALAPGIRLKNAASLKDIDLKDLDFTEAEMTALNELGYQHLSEINQDKLTEHLKGKLLAKTLKQEIEKLQAELN